MVVNNRGMVGLPCLQKDSEKRFLTCSFPVLEYFSVSFELLGFGSTPILATAVKKKI
jgi:hypothetical protein